MRSQIVKDCLMYAWIEGVPASPGRGGRSRLAHVSPLRASSLLRDIEHIVNRDHWDNRAVHLRHHLRSGRMENFSVLFPRDHKCACDVGQKYVMPRIMKEPGKGLV